MVEQSAVNRSVAGSNPACGVTYGGVAQLARANGSYPLGRGFDSLRRYHMLGPIAQLVRADGS